jgi:hypothetical protein
MVTEELWLNPGNRTAELMHWLQGRASARKHRLFVVAYGRTLMSQITNYRVERWLELGELLADSKPFAEDIFAERTGAYRYLSVRDDRRFTGMVFANSFVNHAIATDEYLSTRFGQDYYLIVGQRSRFDARANGLQSELDEIRSIHEIYGNPFRPIHVLPGWLSADVIDLARSIYESKSFDQMPRLSDALIDAGCDQKEIIDHCRDNGPHARGCWVLDLLLEKEEPLPKPDETIAWLPEVVEESPRQNSLQYILRDYPPEVPLQSPPSCIMTQIRRLEPLELLALAYLVIVWIFLFIYMLVEAWYSLRVK